MKNRGTNPRKIAFLGNFNSTNFGNEICLQTILDRVRLFQPNAEFICICNGPDADTVATCQIEAIPLSETFFKSWSPQTPLLKAVRKLCVGLPSEPLRWLKGLVVLRCTHTLIIPGTGLLTDAYGLRSGGWGPYNTFKWSLIAKICGCKLLFVSVGAGPVYSNLGRVFVKAALSLADFRSYRDYSSKQYLESIGFRAGDDPVYPDLVFGLSDSMIPYETADERDRTVVGIGLMEYAGKYSVAQPSLTIEQTYIDNLAVFASWLLTHENDVRLLVGDLNDTKIRQEFRGLLRNRLAESDDRHIIDEPVFAVEDLLSQIATTNIVVATRFHNVVLALLCNKPVIAISFHHKCESLMAAMGLSNYCLDINSFKADALIEKFCDLKANADRLKPLIREKVERFREELDEQYKAIFKDM